MAFRAVLCAAGLAFALTSIHAAEASPSAVITPRVDVIAAADGAAPPPDDPRWQPTAPGLSHASAASWYRTRFAGPDQPAVWGLYLAYLYGGGKIWLNGQLVGEVPASDAQLQVRWERPFLIPLAATALRPGENELLIRAVAPDRRFGTILPALVIGPQAELQVRFDVRTLIVRTLPLITGIVGVLAGALGLLVWSKRRQDVDFGLFGLAAVCWAVRTFTFAIDHASPSVWSAWRTVYFASTGGFIVTLALFALFMAGWLRPMITRGLLAYAALGPAVYVLAGDDATARWWAAGLVPIGVVVVVVVAHQAWRRRSVATSLLAVVTGLALLAGVHDYIMSAHPRFFQAVLPDWSAQRYFLLHVPADLMLAGVAVWLAHQFISALNGVEHANRTLEARVKEREAEIAATYQQVAALQKEQAATDERQRIMRDLHDGLGSQLFTSLSRAERGQLPPEAVTEVLRGAIDQMRVSIEALASDEHDLQTAFGNFRFRWDDRLREAGLAPEWSIDLPEDMSWLSPHDSLQILHIAQEALTNVLKHARARSVRVTLQQGERGLRLAVADDGCGMASARAASMGAEGSVAPAGRGHANMRARARRLGAQLSIGELPQGCCLEMSLPLR